MHAPDAALRSRAAASESVGSSVSERQPFTGACTRRPVGPVAVLVYRMIRRYVDLQLLFRRSLLQPESSNHDADLRSLLTRAAAAASYSGRKMMESAGLSWQSLAAWKAGTRRPRAESIHAVGHALLLRGDRIRRIGFELIRAAERESGHGRVSPVTDDGPQQVLFAPSRATDETLRPSAGVGSPRG